MKRAKIALTAIAVLAATAGTLAFTAQKKFNAVIYLAPAAGQPATIKKVDFTITTDTQASFTNATTVKNDPAVATYITAQL